METKKKIFIFVGSIFLLLVLYYSYRSWAYVGTDNAQIGAHITLLSSRVNGTIVKVLVEENQKVKAGDILAQIDTSDYSNAKESAVAQVAALQARLSEAEANYKRAADLFHEQAISRERYDAAEALFRELNGKMKMAKSQFDQANLNVSYTRIIAPTDGIIARKSVEMGQFVPAGQPLFGFVESKERWVIANLKETELSGVKIGSKAQISVDALPGSQYEAEVESIGPSTGAIFSLLPPDNSTGNFTKVVQRVPVRLKFSHLLDSEIDGLRAGLSALVSIRIH